MLDDNSQVLLYEEGKGQRFFLLLFYIAIQVDYYPYMFDYVTQSVLKECRVGKCIGSADMCLSFVSFFQRYLLAPYLYFPTTSSLFKMQR